MLPNSRAFSSSVGVRRAGRGRSRATTRPWKRPSAPQLMWPTGSGLSASARSPAATISRCHDTILHVPRSAASSTMETPPERAVARRGRGEAAPVGGPRAFGTPRPSRRVGRTSYSASAMAVRPAMTLGGLGATRLSRIAATTRSCAAIACSRLSNSDADTPRLASRSSRKV